MRHTSSRFVAPASVVVALGIILAGCNYPGTPAPQGDSMGTAAAETVAAELTQAAAATVPAPATNTPQPAAPTDTPAATEVPATPSPTAGAVGCTDKAQFVSDVTVPDNTNIKAGDGFVKTWRLKNVGTCTWTTEYALVFSSGNAMGGPAAVTLASSVPPNSTVDLSVNLVAPASNGTFKGLWMLRNANNVLFGIGANADSAFWVQIVVGPTPTPSSTGVAVYHSGKVDLKQTFHVDLDQADGNPASGDADMWFEAVSSSEKYFVPQNGAKMKLITSGAPSYDDCSSASLSSNKINFADVSVNDWMCYKTSAGRYGRFQIENISGDPTVVRLDIRTWAK